MVGKSTVAQWGAKEKTEKRQRPIPHCEDDTKDESHAFTRIRQLEGAVCDAWLGVSVRRAVQQRGCHRPAIHPYDDTLESDIDIAEDMSIFDSGNLHRQSTCHMHADESSSMLISINASQPEDPFEFVDSAGLVRRVGVGPVPSGTY